jgi:hypothetical protein
MRRYRPTLHRSTIALGLSLVALAAAGCGGAPTAPSSDNVFYLHGGGVVDKTKSWEAYYPRLDHEKSDHGPRVVGVGVLEGVVRFARPADWTIRDADYTPEHRFISYQSPRQFTFAIFERVDPDQDTWGKVEQRYEKETQEQGSNLLASRIPVATANAQGRAYLLLTKVRAKPDFEGYATEILVRSGDRVLLVQIVHRQDIESIADEVTGALDSMLVY